MQDIEIASASPSQNDLVPSGEVPDPASRILIRGEQTDTTEESASGRSLENKAVSLPDDQNAFKRLKPYDKASSKADSLKKAKISKTSKSLKTVKESRKSKAVKNSGIVKNSKVAINPGPATNSRVVKNIAKLYDSDSTDELSRNTGPMPQVRRPVTPTPIATKKSTKGKSPIPDIDPENNQPLGADNARSRSPQSNRRSSVSSEIDRSNTKKTTRTATKQHVGNPPVTDQSNQNQPEQIAQDKTTPEPHACLSKADESNHGQSSQTYGTEHTRSASDNSTEDQRESATTQSELHQSASTQPETESSLRGSTQPDSTQPDSIQPDSTQPDSTQPDSTQPDSTQPDSSQYETNQPNHSHQEQIGTELELPNRSRQKRRPSSPLPQSRQSKRSRSRAASCKSRTRYTFDDDNAESEGWDEVIDDEDRVGMYKRDLGVDSAWQDHAESDVDSLYAD